MDMSTFKEYLPVLAPIIILEFVLMILALHSIIKHDRFKAGSKAIWIPVVIFLQIIGPILYFVIGKEDD